MKSIPTLALLIIAAGHSVAATTDWLQWRGPTRDGQIHVGAKAWPATLSESNLKQIWAVPLAEGYSSPVISGDRIFTVETKDKANEIVRAFDRKTGKQLWETSWAGSMKVPFFAKKNGSWVRSTPACDGKTLFVGGMLDVLVALDPASQKILWSTKKTFGDYWSMVANGNRILALDDRGDLLLIEADPAKFKLLNTLEVSGRPTWAHLAVCGNELYIRDLKGLTAYRWE